MENPLSLSEVRELIKKAEEAFRHQECDTCVCYLGYITQLEIDADDERKDYLKGYKGDREQIHSCLGCDPCHPGILYSNYLRNKSSNLKQQRY